MFSEARKYESCDDAFMTGNVYPKQGRNFLIFILKNLSKLAGRPKWPSSKTSTTKSSTFYPKTSTGQNIERLKNRLSKTSTVKNID